MKKNNEHRLSFLILDCVVNVSINNLQLKNILLKMYGVMEIEAGDTKTGLNYIVTYSGGDGDDIVISRPGCEDMVTSDIGEFVFLFEKDMTIELQKIRSDLLFIHSAALEYNDIGFLIVAPSGTGKSTTTWALLNSGFRYLSDELAPLELDTMTIHPYPHALCLKAIPPLFELPEETLHTNYTIHVPGLLCTDAKKPAPAILKYIFYLEFDGKIEEPEIIPISTAESSAKLYANSLNILAHDKGENGIQSAISIAKNANAYILKSNKLDLTAIGIKNLIEKN